MKPWKDCKGLLDLFSVPDSVGAERFIDLVELGALLIRFKLPYRMANLERQMMRELSVSPLLYWSAMKRSVRPLLAAGGDTLRALGVPVEGEPATCHDLAAAVAAAVAEDLGEENRDLAYQIAEVLAREVG